MTTGRPDLTDRAEGVSGPRRAVASDLPAILELQVAAYHKNADILGVEPLPLKADYSTILATMEVWLWHVSDRLMSDRLASVLILEPHADHMLIWSVATHPEAQGLDLGNTMLRFAEEEARKSGLATMRLYTGEPLTANIAWYTAGATA